MILNDHAGEFAAILTTVCWTMSAITFEITGKKIGSVMTNFFKLGIGFIFLAVFNQFYKGMFFPSDATGFNWFWLALSAISGFVICDLFLVKSFTLIGSRISMLIMSLSPIITALISWIALGEVLSTKDILGIVLTVTGISIAILEREKNSEAEDQKNRRRLKFSHPIKGIVMAIVASVGQGVGLILSKHGMGNYDASSASQIRVLIGFMGFAILALFRNKLLDVYNFYKDKKTVGVLLAGTFFGPFMGVPLSLFAVQHTKTGIAATIIATVPIFIIIPAIIFKHEKVKMKEVIGAILAVAGVVFFFI